MKGRKLFAAIMFGIGMLLIALAWLSPQQSGVRATDPTHTPVPNTSTPPASPTASGGIAAATAIATIPPPGLKPHWPTGVPMDTAVPSTISVTPPPVPTEP